MFKNEDDGNLRFKKPSIFQPVNSVRFQILFFNMNKIINSKCSCANGINTYKKFVKFRREIIPSFRNIPREKTLLVCTLCYTTELNLPSILLYLAAS